MAYNLTGLDSGNNIYDYLVTINNATSGYIFSFLLLIIWVILMIGFKNYDTQTGIITSSAIVTLLTVISWGAGFVNMSVMFVPIAMLFAGLIWKGLS